MSPEERIKQLIDKRCPHCPEAPAWMLECSVCLAELIRAAQRDELEACCKVICGRCARGWPFVDKYTHRHPDMPESQDRPPWVCFAAELREQRTR